MKFLKKIREDKGLTHYGMAKELGMIHQSYIQYETKAQGMKFASLCKLRKDLGLSWDQLGRLLDEEFGEKKGKK